jgi:hypothetical protein
MLLKLPSVHGELEHAFDVSDLLRHSGRGIPTVGAFPHVSLAMYELHVVNVDITDTLNEILHCVLHLLKRAWSDLTARAFDTIQKEHTELHRSGDYDPHSQFKLLLTSLSFGFTLVRMAE